MTLQIAMVAMAAVPGDMDVNVQLAYMRADQVLGAPGGNPDGLSRDEGAAINIYTQESELYRRMNAICATPHPRSMHILIYALNALNARNINKFDSAAVTSMPWGDWF